MIIERTSHETIITTADCKYIAVVEAFYGSEKYDPNRSVRFGEVGFNNAICLYLDEFDAFRELLNEVETYLRAKPDSSPPESEGLKL